MKHIYQTIFVTALTGIMFAQTSKEPQSVYSGPSPQINDASISVLSKVQSQVQVWNMEPGYMEGPPIIQPGGWHTYFLSTHFTAVVATPVSLGDDNLTKLNFGLFEKKIVSCPLTWWYDYKPSYMVPNTGLQWRRSYNGIWGSHSIYTTGKGNIVIGYGHGENKNEIIGDKFYQNTVWPEKLIDSNNPTTYSGYDDKGKYHDGWNTYFGFVTMGWVENTQATGWGHQYYWEEGPIAWPSNGYLTTDRKKASGGLRHPSSIQYGGYIYVYFLDTRSVPLEEGRDGGVKVVRVPVNEAWNSNAYQVYYNGGWQASLPAGFSKNNMEYFFDKKGPKSSVILGDAGHNIIKFAVAKIQNTNYFLGMEQYIDDFDNYRTKVVLRLSTDLINWSEPQYTVANDVNYDASNYLYPIFMDKEAWSNDNINPAQFYVLGVKAGIGNIVNRMKLGISIGRSGVLSDNNDQNTVKIDDEVKIKIFQENNILHVTTNENSVRKKISVYSLYGQLMNQQILESVSNEFNIEMNNIPSTGLYIVTIEANNNKYTERVFIKK